MLPVPELSCVSLEWADTDAGKFGVTGVLGVLAPSLRTSMLESWLLVKRNLDWKMRAISI